ncbi:cytochrome b/b6 domain-containing protein [Ruicaihuangia caeni]|uniref:Cytochrome b/b6 domain-containing protein n=1 Tax=Ruicaihuangia caeni TaxID=3042517 RepID=A0AAW6T8P7_9MICO|nr:cytochrome b/b6 domain-containing protein [Klugiella sp. YN-L-19]MDI2098704.1 cytochrome b/b6 domain-containing protein [Klugiella sp. YN-L-19]
MTSTNVARPRWRTLALAIPGAIVAVAVLIVLARWLRELPAVADFVMTHPGHVALPESAPVGIPAWLAWQHFFNAFFIVLIVRSGWSVRTTQRPAAHWTRNNSGLIRTKRPPKRISLDLWFHQTLDVLWIVNGAIFIVMLFTTGHWMRIVPTSWEVFPNALSAGLQYASLDWPLENGWVNYNSLQVLTYFVTVFVAAPLAIISGLRMSAAWPASTARLNRLYPIELARAVHFPVMLYFVLFLIAHITLVFATGALRNLNHMYAARDGASWLGFWIFAASVVVMVVAWVAARPLILRPLAQLMGTVSR